MDRDWSRMLKLSEEGSASFPRSRYDYYQSGYSPIGARDRDPYERELPRFYQYGPMRPPDAHYGYHNDYPLYRERSPVRGYPQDPYYDSSYQEYSRHDPLNPYDNYPGEYSQYRQPFPYRSPVPYREMLDSYTREYSRYDPTRKPVNRPQISRALSKVLKILSKYDGTLAYKELESLYQRNNIAMRKIDLKSIIQKYPVFFQTDDQNCVTLKTDLRICENYSTSEGCKNLSCGSLHICKFFICDTCPFDSECQFGHNISTYNHTLIKKYHLTVLSNQDIFYLLRHQDPALFPKPCKFYNNTNCSRGEKCLFLHICQHYLKSQCRFHIKCKRSHNIYEEQNKRLLIKYGIEVARSPKDVLAQLRVYISRFEGPVLVEAQPEESDQISFKLNDDSDVCYFYGQGKCKFGQKCRNVHVKARYVWLYFSTKANSWFPFEKQNYLEEKYCDPANSDCSTEISVENESQESQTHSVVVNFNDWVVDGPEGIQVTKVRRVGTPSYGASVEDSVTHWIWYWQTDDQSWKKYGDEDNGNKASITSEKIEIVYCELKQKGKLLFSTDNSKYELCFNTLTQKKTNGEDGTVRKARRRPKYIPQNDKESQKSESTTISSKNGSTTLNSDAATLNGDNPDASIQLVNVQNGMDTESSS